MITTLKLTTMQNFGVISDKTNGAGIYIGENCAQNTLLHCIIINL
jgi:hypothetical protein